MAGFQYGGPFSLRESRLGAKAAFDSMEAARQASRGLWVSRRTLTASHTTLSRARAEKESESHQLGESGHQKPATARRGGTTRRMPCKSAENKRPAAIKQPGLCKFMIVTDSPTGGPLSSRHPPSHAGYRGLPSPPSPECGQASRPTCAAGQAAGWAGSSGPRPCSTSRQVRSPAGQAAGWAESSGARPCSTSRQARSPTGQAAGLGEFPRCCQGAPRPQRPQEPSQH